MIASSTCIVNRLSECGRIVNLKCPVRRLGSGERHHFFGYYNKSAWDRTGRYVLGNQVAMMDAPLTPQLMAKVGYFDIEDRELFTRSIRQPPGTGKWAASCNGSTASPGAR